MPVTNDGLRYVVPRKEDEPFCTRPDYKDCKDAAGKRCEFWWMGGCQSKRPFSMANNEIKGGGDDKVQKGASH